HVARDAVDDRPARVRVEEAEAQALELVEHARPELGHEPEVHQLADLDGVRVVEERAGPGHPQHERADHEEESARGPGWRLDAEGPARRGRPGVELVSDDVDREPAETEAREPEPEQHHLQGEHPDAGAAVLERQTEQATEQAGILLVLTRWAGCLHQGYGTPRGKARAARARSVAHRTRRAQVAPLAPASD